MQSAPGCFHLLPAKEKNSNCQNHLSTKSPAFLKTASVPRLSLTLTTVDELDERRAAHDTDVNSQVLYKAS